jgi:GT2 family glycosyltransferase
MAGGRQFAAVRDWDEGYFAEHGCFRFLTPADLNGKGELLEVAYAGMGFMLVKRGVFEQMDYPWFRPIEKTIGKAVDFTMEDVTFCLRVRETGSPVMVDPAVTVGHMKSTIL